MLYPRAVHNKYDINMQIRGGDRNIAYRGYNIEFRTII